MALKSQRKLFRLEEHEHYLNCAYQAPLLRSAEAAGQEALRKRARPYDYTVQDFFKPIEKLKKAFARLIGASDQERVALIPSVSYGVATITSNLELASSDNIVIVAEQFPSNVYGWRRLCERYQAQLRVVEAPAHREEWGVQIAMAIDENTRAVSLGHVHWADGTRFPLKGIAEKARSMGALVVIDGTQSIGAMPFPFDEIQPDAVLCAGYKWLLGPYSLGCAYYGPWFDDKLPLEDNWIARRNSDDFQSLVNYEDAYRPKAYRFSVGETSNFMLIPMLLNTIKQVNKWGPANIQKYCKRLIKPHLDHWSEMGYAVADDAHRGSHLFGIRLPKGTQAESIKPILNKHRVHVSFRGDCIRVSPHVYNDKSDIQALTQALKEYAYLNKSVMA